jgi:hypothetical protein
MHLNSERKVTELSAVRLRGFMTSPEQFISVWSLGMVVPKALCKTTVHTSWRIDHLAGKSGMFAPNCLFDHKVKSRRRAL